MISPATTGPPPAQFIEDLDKPGSSANDAGSTTSPLLFGLIAQQPFFKGLNSHQLQRLTDSAMEIQFEPGQVIFQEGSPANRFYLILAGKVVLETEREERGIFPLQTLGPGDDLGWSWLFPPYLLHSSARALMPTRAIFFYGTRLREQCEQDHDLGYELMRRVAEVVIEQLRATQERLLAGDHTHNPVTHECERPTD